MARRRIFWHIGPDDLGTAHLAHGLDARREELAAQGVLVPGTTTAWELATVELRRNHQQLGYRRREVEGQCAALARLIWRHHGTTVLSTPGLAAATPDQVALTLDGVRGAEVHLVLVVRDLTSQVYAAAQAALELGATTRPEKYAARVLDPQADHPQVRAFYAGHDLPDVLGRWARHLPVSQVHVVNALDPDDAWTALMRLVGADVPAPPATPTALDLAGLTALREVVLGLDDRVDARQRRETVRDWLAQGVLGGGHPAYPVVDDRAGLVERWSTHLATKGYDVRGSVRLHDRVPAGEERRPADVAENALADAVAEVARLRGENTLLREENDRLDRKRRKHKRRAKELQREGAA